MKTLPLQLDVSSATSDHEKMVLTMANQCARLFALADFHICFQFRPADVAPLGNTTKAGLLLAAVEMRDVLGLCSQGRKALEDLGFEPVLEHREGE